MANHSRSNFFDWLAACLVGIVGHGLSIHMQPGPYIVIMNSKQDPGISAQAFDTPKGFGLFAGYHMATLKNAEGVLIFMISLLNGNSSAFFAEG